MIPDCKEVSALLSQEQDRPLRWGERVRLRMHLLMCRGCGNFKSQLDFLRTAVRNYRDNR